MAEQQVLRRKAARDSGRSGDDAPTATAETEFAKALSRAMQDVLALRLAARSVDLQSWRPEEAAEAFTGQPLIVLVQNGDAETGLLVFDNAAFVALVCHKLTGLLPATPDTTARAPTRVDASLLRDVVDAILGQLHGPDGAAAKGAASRWAYTGFLSDARLVKFALADARHVVTDAQIVLGADQVTGRITLMLPPPRPDETRTKTQDTATWRAGLSQAVLGAPLRLKGELAKLSLTLSQLRALKQGDDLRLPRSAIDQVRLVTNRGTTPWTGKLGQMNGDRAVRLDPSGAGPAGHDADQPTAPGALPPGDQAPAP